MVKLSTVLGDMGKRTLAFLKSTQFAFRTEIINFAKFFSRTKVNQSWPRAASGIADTCLIFNYANEIPSRN